MTESGKGDQVQRATEEPTLEPTAEPTSSGTGTTSGRPPSDDQLQPLSWSTGRIVLAGIALWAVALVVTLLVPSLHSGDRSWWPWTCVAGIGLGLLGYLYVRRGRGNARGAR